MSRRPALDIETLVQADDLAKYVANLWTKYDSLRSSWLDDKLELRNFIYATDTRTTSVDRLDWSNSTTTPKLCQIFDNLLANYTAAIFPKDRYFQFIPGNDDAAAKDKNTTVQAYMENKARQSNFIDTNIKLLIDWVIYGVCFGTVDFVREYNKLESGEEVKGYVGPKAIRISPYDIVFDPTVAEWKDTPKVIRSLKSYADIQRMDPTIFDRIMFNRGEVGAVSQTKKSSAYVADGFSSIESYYNSPYVEVLTFYGDIYNRETRELQERRVIKVVDRAYVICNDPQPSWFGNDAIYYSGWRHRPDNLWAMGPLDNLVGLQYRIDHLENLKADIWDLTAGPMTKIRGEVDDFEIGPLKRIYVGSEGDVEFLTPPPLALQADQQIAILEQKMEEFAGAPKMAMGFRTPGEKTKFEVQTLDNAANRIFNHKASQYEREILEPLLMSYLESAKREMDESEVISISDKELGIDIFQTITKENITADGTFRAVGSRYFADQANRVQTLNTVLAVKGQMPDVGVHWSGKRIAQIMAEELEEDDLFEENIQVHEAMETAKAQQDAQVDFQDDQMTKAELGF